MTHKQHLTTVPEAHVASAPAFEAAYQAAQKSLAEGGIPIGAALARDGVVIASGHNERVQKADPMAHGEMSALRAAGRQRSYRDTALYTTLAPCAMCAGTIIQFKVPRVVVGEARTFDGERCGRRTSPNRPSPASSEAGRWAQGRTGEAASFPTTVVHGRAVQELTTPPST